MALSNADGPHQLKAWIEQKGWLFPKEVKIPPVWLLLKLDKGVFLPLGSSWCISSSWISSLPALNSSYTIGPPMSPACQVTPWILGLVSLHNRVSWFLVINLFPPASLSVSLLVLFLWRTLTATVDLSEVWDSAFLAGFRETPKLPGSGPYFEKQRQDGLIYLFILGL